MKLVRGVKQVGVALLLAVLSAQGQAATTVLNVSYDVAREFFKDYNVAFEQYWKGQGGDGLTINQSHGGSSKQARAVADGLEADVVTLNQDNDIDFLADKGLLPQDWQKQFKYNSSPYSSTMVFLVRAGNPKKIHDWNDLLRNDVKVIIPNPKTSGNGRYSFLAAWTYALKERGGNEAKAKDFVQKLFHNVPVLDTGGRAATTTFVQRGIGDVLVTFENEVYLTQKEFGADKVDIVYPAVSIATDLPVAVVQKYADKHGTTKTAQAYLGYLYSPAGQEIAARHFLRPRDPAVFQRYAAVFHPIRLYTVREVFGSWDALQKKFFDDGGVFDQIYVPGK